jgi:hypothetical protein
VVALEPPAPPLVARLAEDGDPVVLAVPAAPPALGPVQHLLQRDDGHGLRVGMRAEHGGEQLMRRLARRAGHRGEAGAGPGLGAVLQPAAGRVVGERVSGRGALLVVQQ